MQLASRIAKGGCSHPPGLGVALARRLGKDRTTMRFNVCIAFHHGQQILVWHDEFMRWWFQVQHEIVPSSVYSKAAAQSQAHGFLHSKHSPSRCNEEVSWAPDEDTRADVLGSCLNCGNPDVNLRYPQVTGEHYVVACPDCGWETSFSQSQINGLETGLYLPLTFPS